jgi:hypothetical protein
MSSKDPPDNVLDGHPRYRQLKYINRGSFGFVVLAENLQTKEQVAIKFVRVEWVVVSSHSLTSQLFFSIHTTILYITPL